VPNSVLEAIKQGVTTFEPRVRRKSEFDSTEAIPGSNAKLAVLARRAEAGLPLWHPDDRLSYDDKLAE
jgi:hypothetical protein